MEQLQLSNNFKKIFTAFESGANLIVQQGGQGSGKTFSTLQLLYIIACNEKRLITVCSFALPHLRGGAMRDFEKIIEQNSFNAKIEHNKSNNLYKINNSIVEFFGIEGNEAKAHGLRRDILYVNESNKRISYKVFDQLFSRTHYLTIIDYNPSSEFWYHEKIKDNFKHAFIKSNYTDNQFLPISERENIESKRDKRGFENWWKVYGLGELGQLEGAILNNWEFGLFDSSLPFGYGLDFGSKDPDAMVKVAIDRKINIIYVHEEIYQSGLSTNQLVQIIKQRTNNNNLIIADSASPRTIQDLKTQGLNITAVQKGAGSIIEGIKMLQNYKIIVSETSLNLQRELNSWVWIDRKGNIPLDSDNHLIDALRYYVLTNVRPTIHKPHRVL